ncbi:hypothetical protein H2204_010288 [Knufia peltigerae]|uniref:Uncharacterized protein n=1 Tax=Knufia peltigerae TaxID=1002370 RepID=A0AA38XWG2_9EURO|nr:hypothetical protein H2204_010288 [Knufia peltigerae]
MIRIEKVAVVFGASGGLGEATVVRVAQDYNVVVGYYRGESKAQKLVDGITKAGRKATALQVDMKDSESVRQFFMSAKQVWGRLDCIISATGPPITLGPLAEASPDHFKRVVETDIIGSFNIIKHGVPVLEPAAAATAGSDGSFPSILLFLTCAVQKTLDWDGLSFIPKMGVVGIVKQAARELGPKGIRVNGLAPGTINAGIVFDSFAADKYGAAVLENQGTQTPMGRRGEAHEIAEVAAFLVSPKASYVSGQIIGVDGGFSA